MGDGGVDYTDVHHLQPSDWNVNAARGNKLFGSCGIVDIEEDCVVPAHSQAANDTAADNVVWLPPANKRGDIARAMFYMDPRYDGDADPPVSEVLLEATRKTVEICCEINPEFHQSDEKKGNNIMTTFLGVPLVVGAIAISCYYYLS